MKHHSELMIFPAGIICYKNSTPACDAQGNYIQFSHIQYDYIKIRPCDFTYPVLSLYFYAPILQRTHILLKYSFTIIK